MQVTVHQAVNTQKSQPAPLYMHYAGQIGAQPAYLNLDCEDAVLSADWSGEIGNGMPMDVWHRRCLRWKLPAEMRGGALALLIESPELIALAQRIVDGYKCEWDGNNLVGRYTDDAEAAIEAVERMCDDYTEEDLAQVWTPGDWLEPALNWRDAEGNAQRGRDGAVQLWIDNARITRATTDAEIAALAEHLADQAEADGVVLDGDMESVLIEARDDLDESDPADA